MHFVKLNVHAYYSANASVHVDVYEEDGCSIKLCIGNYMYTVYAAVSVDVLVMYYNVHLNIRDGS